MRHAPLIYRTFDGYASMDSNGDVASMAYNSYKIFITDCEVARRACRYRASVVGCCRVRTCLAGAS